MTTVMTQEGQRLLVARADLPSDLTLTELLTVSNAVQAIYGGSRGLVRRNEADLLFNEVPRSPRVERLHFGSPMEILVAVPPAIAGTLFIITKAVKALVEAVRINVEVDKVGAEADKLRAEADKLRAEADYIRSQDEYLRNEIEARREFLRSAQGRQLVAHELTSGLRDAGSPRAAEAVEQEIDLKARWVDEGEPKPIPRTSAQVQARALVEAAEAVATYGVDLSTLRR
ncbi:hypothetical protein [Microbacterium sp. LBN7]|uniref:hypothetical protein n=1 Tax=Microbacterium sp. LBN7 TaxID=3129773 RepID=UPI00324CEF38